jgi:AcrR family transcriptional regulator
MNSIAEAAEVTKPVIYECYPNKDQLFKALLEREQNRLLEAIGAALPSEVAGGDIERVVTEGLTAFFSAAADAPSSWRVVFDSQGGGAPAIARRVSRARASILETVRSLVEAVLASTGVEQAARKSPVLAEMLISVAEGGVRVLLESKGDWTAEELGELLGRVAVRGATAA